MVSEPRALLFFLLSNEFLLALLHFRNHSIKLLASLKCYVIPVKLDFFFNYYC
jgi:hypothetical protein